MGQRGKEIKIKDKSEFDGERLNDACVFRLQCLHSFLVAIGVGAVDGCGASHHTCPSVSSVVSSEAAMTKTTHLSQREVCMALQFPWKPYTVLCPLLIAKPFCFPNAAFRLMIPFGFFAVL